MKRLITIAFVLMITLIPAGTCFASRELSKSEMMTLARVVHAESGGESDLGQQAVAAVVLNRLQSRGKGATVQSVVYERGQFSVVRSRSFSSLRPSARVMRNVRLVLRGKRVLPSSVQYFKSSRLSVRWGSRSFYTRIGGHLFYK